MKYPNYFRPIENVRNDLLWRSFGKFHDEPAKDTLLKDISDSHLLHIIAWIEDRRGQYTDDILYAMKEEQKYRTKHYIFIPDYDTKSN